MLNHSRGSNCLLQLTGYHLMGSKLNRNWISRAIWFVGHDHDQWTILHIWFWFCTLKFEVPNINGYFPEVLFTANDLVCCVSKIFKCYLLNLLFFPVVVCFLGVILSFRHTMEYFVTFIYPRNIFIWSYTILFDLLHLIKLFFKYLFLEVFFFKSY